MIESRSVVIMYVLPMERSTSSVQFSSVAQSCLTLGDPMNCSTPGLPVHHQLPEFTQTHVHQVGDAIQPSHPLSSPSPPTPSPSQHQVFSNESTLHMRWPKYWSFSFSISPSDCPGGSDSKASVYSAGGLGLIPGLGSYLEKDKATHSSTLA